jgi:hypothetical protein
MISFDARGMLGQCVAPRMAGFMEWVVTQDRELLGHILACLVVVAAVQEGRLLASTPFGDLPHAWAMEKAACDLRNIAQAVGFADAAWHCEEVRQEASVVMLHMQELYGIPAQA